MRRKSSGYLLGFAVLVTLLATDVPGNLAGRLYAKERNLPISPDDPTFRLYQLLDSSYGGKLAELYIIADIFKDPKKPEQENQHILRVEYDKNRVFGKLRINVRTVAKLTPEQLKIYNAKQAYEFAEVDSEKFTKTDPGPLGRPGDVYARAEEGRPLVSAPITDEARSAYERFITEHILPALQKK
jgi:hypothetical protein